MPFCSKASFGNYRALSGVQFTYLSSVDAEINETATSTDEDIKMNFMKNLKTRLNQSYREILIVIGDFNAIAGETENDNHIKHRVGRYR